MIDLRKVEVRIACKVERAVGRMGMHRPYWLYEVLYGEHKRIAFKPTQAEESEALQVARQQLRNLLGEAVN